MQAIVQVKMTYLRYMRENEAVMNYFRHLKIALTASAEYAEYANWDRVRFQEIDILLPFAAGQSRGTKAPCWWARHALRQNRLKNYHFRWCKLFACLVQVRFLLTSKVFLYHVTDQLQRAHFLWWCCSVGVPKWSRRLQEGTRSITVWQSKTQFNPLLLGGRR